MPNRVGTVKQGKVQKEMMKARRRTGLRKKFLDGKLTMNEDSVKKGETRCRSP